MQIVKTPRELNSCGGKVAVTLGMFDGVHVGHRQIIRDTLAEARRIGGVALVITFDRHPETVLAPAQAPLLIQPLWHRLRAIESLGVDYLWLIAFDTRFSQQHADVFVRRMVSDLGGLQSFCVGADFVFGHKQSGNLWLLKKLGAELKFEVHSVQPVLVDGTPVSSTRIRKAIGQGDLTGASGMLGRAYALAGTVVRGDGLGRTLGFPTANLDTTGLVLPPNGVYAALARIDNETYQAAVNIGCRPTVHPGAEVRTVEAHLLDASGDFYGKHIELEFVGRLRDEKTFPSIEVLKSQIAADVAQARRLLLG